MTIFRSAELRAVGERKHSVRRTRPAGSPRSHWIPQFILQRFSHLGGRVRKVWLYDKDSGNQRFDSIKNATVRRVITKDLEEQKGTADGVVSRLVNSIERDQNIDSAGTHMVLCASAMYLWLCGLPMLQDSDDLFRSGVDLVDGTLKAVIDGRAWMAPQDPGGYGPVDFRVLGADMIRSCSSHFLMAGGRSSFVTSDRIVALEGGDGGVGIGNFATATFPFAPRRAIQIRAGGPPLFRRPAEILDDASVRRINWILMDRASRFIVSDSRITAKPAQRVTRFTAMRLTAEKKRSVRLEPAE